MCDQVLPVLDAAAAAGAPVRILSQSEAAETAEQARRVGLRAIPELDDGLELSARFDPDAVPALLLLDAGEERGRVEGLHRARMSELAAAAGAQLDLDGLPEMRPGCASRTRDPEVAARLAARRARADGRIRSRAIDVGALEDPFEALFERGLTDGLPVVPPTPERVVAMLEHTSRDPQEVVGRGPALRRSRDGREGRGQRGHGRVPGRRRCPSCSPPWRRRAPRSSRCTASSPRRIRPGRPSSSPGR